MISSLQRSEAVVVDAINTYRFDIAARKSMSLSGINIAIGI